VQGRRRRGCKLIELLVTLAIMAVVTAMIVPLYLQAAQRMVRHRCLNNVRSQGIAFRLYALDHGGRYPPPAPTSPTGPFPDGHGFAALLIYTEDPSIFYCPANLVLRPVSNGLAPRPPGCRVAGYACWARYTVGPRLPAMEGVATSSTDGSHTILASDIIATRAGDPGSPHPYTSHRGESIQGGFMLHNDGHVTWRDYGRTRLRLSCRGGLDWYF